MCVISKYWGSNDINTPDVGSDINSDRTADSEIACNIWYRFLDPFEKEGELEQVWNSSCYLVAF